MQTQHIQQEMLRYFMKLNDDEQKSILQLIKTFLAGRKEGYKTSVEDYNREIEEADAAIEAGEYVTHEEVMKRHSKS